MAAVTTQSILDNMANMFNYSSDALFNGTENFTVSLDNFTGNITTAAPQVAETDHLVVRDLIYNHLGPFVCVFGMLTNIINLIVLTQNQLPESPYTSLTGLACTDFTALMLSFIYMKFSKDTFTYEWRFFDAYIFLGLVNVCTTSSVWITVQLTVERFLFVRHPLWAKDTCDRASAKVKVLMTVAAAAIFNIPRFLVFKPKMLSNGLWILDSTEFRRGTAFFVINWVYSVCIHFLPLVVLSCANIYLVYAVHQAGQQRQKLHIRNNREAAWQREQRRLTITLISIVFLFIVCIIPSAFSDFPIAFALFGGDKTEIQFKSSSFYLSLQYIANFLVWLELSLNFVLYCAFNEKFRRVMKFTATRCIKKLNVPFCRKKGNIVLHVNFKSGQSSTRNSVLHTNSLSMNSKGSLVHHEAQPLQKQMDTGEKKDTLVNGDTPLLNQAV